ncbi:MAG TPA: VLRF1 family aeRF1-type release factor [Acidobacteriota bacterium]|nr:VLRF1 family aeRF1-type release factor [Acidobacteriota bacterium]
MALERIHLQDEIDELLEELLSLEESDHLFVSLYLDTSVNAEGQRLYPIYLKQKVADLVPVIEGAKGEAGVRELRENVAQIEIYLGRGLEKSTRGVAIFSCKGHDFFRALQLPVPVRNKIAASRAPNLDVLIELLQQTHHFCVVVFDQQSARIFSVYLTDIVGKRHLSNPAFPPHTQPGSASRVRYDRRTRDQVQQFLRELAETIENLMRSEKTQGLVLLGTQANIAELRKFLSAEIDKQVLLTQAVPPTTTDSELIDRVLAEVQRREQLLSRQTLEQLYDRLSQDYLSAAGLEATLLNLQLGKVQTLVISSQFNARGKKCTRCGSLFTLSGDECTYCRTPTVEVDLRNQMEKQAERQGAKIEIIQGASFLDHLDGVGALLKF